MGFQAKLKIMKTLLNVTFWALYVLDYITHVAVAIAPFVAIRYWWKGEVEFWVAFISYLIFTSVCLIFVVYPIWCLLDKIATTEDPSRRSLKHQWARHMSALLYAIQGAR